MSSLISTNTVFHFTKSIDNLEGILKSDFYPQICCEDFIGTISNEKHIEKGVPMVCFCDIPLSQIRKHVENYGDYALGLSKEWAMKNQVNPVIYTYPNSGLANELIVLSNKLVELEKNKNEDLVESKIIKQYMSTIQYVKPYEGRLWKNGNWTEKVVRFYDEREWRFIPQVLLGKQTLFLGRDLLFKSGSYDILQELNNKIRETDDCRLSFEPKDIKFIIVSKENEILSMIDKVIQIKRNNFPYKEVQILTTRIISIESINENF